MLSYTIRRFGQIYGVDFEDEVQQSIDTTPPPP
jgi:hypothetical protein